MIIMRFYYPLLIVLLLLLLVQTGQAEESALEDQARECMLEWEYETEDAFPIRSVSVSLDGRYITIRSTELGRMSYSPSGTLHKNIYRLDKDGELLWTHEIHGDTDTLSDSASSDGAYIVAVGRRNIYGLNTERELLWTYKILGNDPLNDFFSAFASSEGDYIVAGSDDGEIYLLNNVGELLWTYTASDNTILSVSASSDGDYIVVGSDDGEIHLLNREGALLWKYEVGQFPVGVSISPDSNYIAVGSGYMYSTHSKFSTSLSASYPFTRICFLNKNGELLWSRNVSEGTSSSELKNVNSVAVSSDGRYIAAGSDDKNVYVFNKVGELLCTYETDSFVRSVSISADGVYVAAGTENGKVFFLINPEGLANVIAENFINEVESIISREKSKSFNVAEAESRFSHAKETFSSGDYSKASELAEQAKALAIDIDQDGAPNDSDFAPTINNSMIYAGVVILLAGSAITFRTGLKTRERLMLERQRKERERRREQERMKQERLRREQEELRLKEEGRRRKARMMQDVLDMIEEVTNGGG